MNTIVCSDHKFNLLRPVLIILAWTILAALPQRSLAQTPVCVYCNIPLSSSTKPTDHQKDCPYYPKQGASQAGSAGTSQNTQMQLMEGLVSSFINLVMKSPDNSKQQKLDEEERQRQLAWKQADDKRKKEAFNQWKQFQSEEETRREMESSDKINRGQNLLLKMQTMGSQNTSVARNKLEIQPIGKNSFVTNKYSEFEKLMCAAYFSDLAKNSTNAEDIKFYADQAELVMAGQPTFLECRISKVSDEKMAKRVEEVKVLYNEMNVKFKDLENIESMLQVTRDTLKKAEIKKEEVKKKISELQNRTLTVSQEEKAKSDEMLIEAQKLLMEADQEINQLKQSEKDFLNKKSQSENELNNLKTQIQGKIQTGDK
jgi:hypothetical protein